MNTKTVLITIAIGVAVELITGYITTKVKSKMEKNDVQMA